ncbi:hypothetical protein EYF80_045949 [Liparis tanakae]|uniref:Uncharacterized protein n=1 Tax=Liparis tanakae TaxID=230148 RepID=A0A4Z2FSF2_9TELE|nr:hypothetical protein EYF80_045949 [Liparis tanakae]
MVCGHHKGPVPACSQAGAPETSRQRRALANTCLLHCWADINYNKADTQWDMGSMWEVTETGPSSDLKPRDIVSRPSPDDHGDYEE